jgi:hypothetical protein
MPVSFKPYAIKGLLSTSSGLWALILAFGCAPSISAPKGQSFGMAIALGAMRVVQARRMGSTSKLTENGLPSSEKKNKTKDFSAGEALMRNIHSRLRNSKEKKDRSHSQGPKHQDCNLTRSNSAQVRWVACG